MPAVPNLVAYRAKLANHIDNVVSLKNLMIDLGGGAKGAAFVLGKLNKAKTDTEKLGDTADDAQLVLKTTEKVGALKTPSRVLGEAAEKVETTSDKLKGDMDEALTKLDADNQVKSPLVGVVQELLSQTGSSLLTRAAEYYRQEVELRKDLDAVDQMIDALTAEPSSLDGSTDFSQLLAAQNALAAEVEAQALTRLDLLPDEGADYPGIIDKLESLQGFLRDIDFDLLDVAFGKLNGLSLAFDTLSGPLEAVAALLRPIEPLLDTAGAALDLLLAPVNTLIQELGLQDLLDTLTDTITAGLPAADLLQPLIDLMQWLKDDLDDFADNAFRLPEFMQYSADLQIGDALEGPTGIGTPIAETLEGDAGRDILDALAGDDIVRGMGGDDFLIAGEGNDTLDGGAGIDVAYFEGSFNQYELARETGTDRIIVTHVVPGRGVQHEGTSLLDGVEYVMFANITFTIAQLESALIGTSVLNGTNEGELMFLRTLGSLPDDGSVQNDGTGALNADGQNEANGFGGNDTMFGSTGNDELNGGAGNDLMLPGLGDDEVNGGGPGTVPGPGDGRDTYQVLDDDANRSHRIDLTTGDAFGEGRDTLSSIENLVIGRGGNHDLRGNAEDNTLITNEGDDVVGGDGGDDLIITDEGRDMLVGGDGSDTLEGGSENDILISSGAHQPGVSDLYDGGSGRDVLSYSRDYNTIRNLLNHFSPNERNVARDMLEDTGSDPGRIFLETETGRVERRDAAGATVAVDLFENIESFIGSDRNDTIRGHYDLDADFGVGIDGAGGNDLIYTGGATRVDGGAGDDRLMLTADQLDAPGTLNIGGGGGTDVLDLRGVGEARWRYYHEGSIAAYMQAFDPNSKSNLLNSNTGSIFRMNFYDGGIERVIFSDADVYIFNRPGGAQFVDFVMGAGNDVVQHEGQDGVFRTGAGNDSLTMQGDGIILAGAGDDTITLRGAEVDFRGEAGNDFADLRSGDGSFDGGAGFDIAGFTALYGNGVTVDLATGTATGSGRNPINSSVVSSIDVTLADFEGVIGTEGNDSLTGDDGANRLMGEDGRDTIHGAAGSDNLFGGDDRDSITGGAGNDSLHGGLGDDTLDGGAGTDTASYSNALPGAPGEGLRAEGYGGVRVDLTIGRVTGSFGTDTLISIENVFGTEGDDAITGNDQDNVLAGKHGDDNLIGLGGDDLLIAGGGLDTLTGGGGNDRILVGLGRSTVDGGAGTDTLQFGSDAGEIVVDFAGGTYSGTLEIPVAVWTDTGTAEARNFSGQSITPEDVRRTDPLYAQAASDLRLSLPDPDSDEAPRFQIRQETGEEAVSGRFSGIETVASGTAATRLILTAGVENFDGQVSDLDVADASASTGALVADLAAGTFGGALFSGDTLTDMEGVIGGGAADVLAGNRSDNLLSGNAGADYLSGRFGADTLEGGAGNDTMIGGAGADDMDGGAGSDILIGGTPADAVNSVRAQIFRAYQATLDRYPDTNGLDNWADRVETGELTLQEAIGGFVQSAEFQNVYGPLNPRAFVTLLYNNVLNRNPDDAGLGNWVDRINDGQSRESVVLGFSESAEFKAETALLSTTFATAGESAPFMDDVFRLYRATLDREPDPTGLANWAGRLADGQTYLDITTGFIASREFSNTYGNLNNSEFVTQLYRNVLNREPDASGLASWVGRLDSGDSKESVVRGFAQSREFISDQQGAFTGFMGAQTGDTLDGGQGPDVLVGSDHLADSFVFGAGDSGTDLVLGLNPWDILDFRDFDYASRAEVVARMSEIGPDVQFSDGQVNVRFRDTSLGDIEDVSVLF